MNSLLKVTVAALALVTLGGCGARPDVDVSGPNLPLDTTNPIFPPLARALKANPSANTFRLSWLVTPDATRPNESLPHYLLYDRKAKTLVIHRGATQYQQFTGVTDAHIARVGARLGAADELVDAGCKSIWWPENG